MVPKIVAAPTSEVQLDQWRTQKIRRRNVLQVQLSMLSELAGVRGSTHQTSLAKSERGSG
jgi:hypothetical protein